MKILINKIECEIGIFINWIRWCIQLKEILPWSVGLISHGNLTQEKYDFAENLKIDLVDLESRCYSLDDVVVHKKE